MSAAYPLVSNWNAFSTRSRVRISPSQLASSPISTISRWMRSGVYLFYIAIFFVPAVMHAQADPDALYRQRANLDRAREAAAIWESRLAADARDFEAAWKLARAMYWLGGHAAQEARRKALEHGVAAGQQAAALQPGRPEGHFWMAANMGALAESFGMLQGLRYRGPIKDALETVLRLDPAFQQGSADRALGRWYFKVPGLFGGSKKKSEEHLRKSLTYNPDSTASHSFLAETLFALNRDAEAIEELKKVLAAPLDPEWEPEDRDFKQKAMERLKRR
jgi:tetratricopeptide (TPR) repeat protein